jgi:cardiolipin synthase
MINSVVISISDKKGMNKMSSIKSDQIMLLKKSKRGVIRIIFGRAGIVLMLLTAQVLVLINVFRFLESLIPYTVGTLLVFTVMMVLYVINSDHNTSVKLSWITLIMLLPGFGGLLYFFIQTDIGHRTIKKQIKVIVKETQSEFAKQEGIRSMKTLQQNTFP